MGNKGYLESMECVRDALCGQHKWIPRSTGIVRGITRGVICG